MSPSWIERTLGRPCRTVVFNRRSVRVTSGWRWRGEFRVSHQVELALPEGFFDVEALVDAPHAALLADRLREAVPVSPRHVPVWVAMPDSLADVLSFPLKRGLSIRAAQAVLTARLQRELAWVLAPRIAVQRLGRTAEHDIWLAAATDAELHSRADSALREAGLTPWSTRPSALWRHDALLAMCAHGQSAVFVSADAHETTLTFWGADGHVRWCRARWDGPDADVRARTEVIRQRCLEYVNADPDHRLEAVHFLVDSLAAGQLADHLDTHLQIPCLRHVPPAGTCVTTQCMVGSPWPCPWPSPVNPVAA